MEFMITIMEFYNNNYKLSDQNYTLFITQLKPSI